MKTIALMPVKNEAWILPQTLRILDAFCDAIIIGDQMSEDGSKNIYANFSKVIVIENREVFHSNRIRWKLLDSARNFDGNNLIICCDADEVFPPKLFASFLARLDPGMFLGKWILFRWIQLWKSLRYYRDDGVWQNRWMTVAFVDDRKLDYDRRFVINDHTSRLPGPQDSPQIKVEEAPLLHFQWVCWEKTQIKQAYYRCAELIHAPHNPYAINVAYSHAFDNPDADLKPVPEQWLEGIDISDNVACLPAGWQLRQIMSWFEEYGIQYFEPLQIWHVPELRREFLRHVGREPKPKVKPPLKSILRSFVGKRLRQVKNKWLTPTAK